MFSRFWGIFWVNAQSEDSITNGFADIARTCDHQDRSLEGMMMWLQNSHHSWLLILDNADNEDVDLAQFLPAGRNGSILITTRLTECTKHQTVGNDCYERLEQDTAINLLLKACEIGVDARSEHEDHARAIVELLGCHALAVIQAGAAISRGLCDLTEYTDIFRVQRQDLLEFSPKQAQSEYGGVYATFEVTAKYLEGRDDQVAKDALQLLNFYAFMHFSDFPESAFNEAWKNSRDAAVVSSRLSPDDDENIGSLTRWHVDHLPIFMQKNWDDDGLDKLRINGARSLLASLSLITFDSARGGTTHMHPVTHVWSRDRLREPEMYTSASVGAFAVLSLCIRNPYVVDPLPISKQLQYHIESIAYSRKEWDHPIHGFHLQQSIFRLANVLYRLQCDSALHGMLRGIPLKENEAWIRTENGQMISFLHGRYMNEFGDAERAVLLLERLTKVLLEALDADSLRVLSSQQTLAIAYLKIQDTSKAIPLLERIVHIYNRTLSPEESDRLSAMHALARAYLEMEETTIAINLLEEIVKIETETLRPEHPERLKSQHELARAYLEANETDKAIVLFEEVVEMKTRTLRPEHHDRLASQHELARAYLSAKETDKAIALLEAVVGIRARTLKEDHPDRVRSTYTLVRCHYRARNYKRALGLARSVEGVARNRPGDEIADWNAELIVLILEEMGMEGDEEEEDEGRHGEKEYDDEEDEDGDENEDVEDEEDEDGDEDEDEDEEDEA